MTCLTKNYTITLRISIKKYKNQLERFKAKKWVIKTKTEKSWRLLFNVILEPILEKMEHKSLNNALKSKRLNQMYDSDVTDTEGEANRALF